MHSLRPLPPSGRRGLGFTLVELLVALTVAGLLLVAAIAGLGDWLPRQQQRQQAQALAEALQLARSEAIKRGHRVALCPSADARTCDPGARWERGWVVFDDPDRDGQPAAVDAIVRVEQPAPEVVTIRGNKPVAQYVSYTSLGQARLASGALQMGTFVVCARGQDELHVVLANGGRPRIQGVASRCP
jgi:type IV fimbrial biogenesis protein FimT